MTTDSQPSEQPKSTAKFGFPEVVELGPLRILTPEEREEWKRNSPQTRRPQRVSFGGVVRLGPLRILSPEEREEWKRNSPSSAEESHREAEPPAAD